jgi:hypothetical protein
MSEDTDSEREIEEKYKDEPRYTIDVNNKRYELSLGFREAIQERAQSEYRHNEYTSCWWRVAGSEDADDDETVHELGDPILVIETVGRTVPWERLDQLELEMQDTSSFDGFEDTSDVDEGNGMRTLKPGDDDGREMPRSHFSVTPQGFEELPSPEGEDPDKIPQMPEQFDEPTLVKWVPEDPERTHTWATGEAITSVDSWVEWNVQQKALQPTSDGDWQNHYESMLNMHDCEQVAELKPVQSPPSKSQSGSVKRKGKQSFDEGKYGGSNWTV